MKYNSTVTLKDGRACILRNGTASDGQALLRERLFYSSGSGLCHILQKY